MNASVMLLKAVQNNIDWCDAVARAHGHQPAMLGGYWYCDATMPSLFPNIITMAPGVFSVSTINDLITAPDRPWAIKDSFAEHDRHQTPFRKLFSSQWYFSESLDEVREPSSFLPLERCLTQTDFDHWLAAWDDTGEHKGVLPFGLLSDERIQMVSLGTTATPICGAVLFFSQEVLGISNLFGDKAELQRLVRTIQLTYPDRPIVGYGDDSELTLLRPFGFRTLGPVDVLISE